MNRFRRYPRKLMWRLYFVCMAVSLVLDALWLHSHAFHYHFSFQYFPEFFALFGLFGCMLLILIAKGIGHFIVADEDYYKDKSRSQK
ncbi:MAG: hypothetical protein JRH06_12570 [Deltaproteobacteria bacterium]|nr:hypothetical protein [Deltaproteobacteria bacterium]MBW2138376.1 hypothetical protein [Deltaproteobacteria bacterium]